jgi:MFS family permease
MRQKVERLYEYLADEEDARVCKDISDSACRVVPGNFFIIFLSQFLTKLADALASAKIVLPWLLTSAGAPSFFSGLLVPIRESGSMLPQLLIGGFVRHYAIRKWFFVAGSIMQGICVAAMAWVGLQFTGAQAGYLLLVLLMLFSLARGLCSVASKDVLGKTIPKTRRGLLSGYCASAAGLVTVCVGAVLMLVARPDTEVYALLLLAAGLCWTIAAVVFATIREYPGASDGGGNAITKAFANLSLLRTDAPFRNFLLVRCLLMSSGLAAPYFVMFARQSSGDDSLVNLGTFIIAGGVADLVSGIAWGRFADRSSKWVLMFTALTTSLLCAVTALLVLLTESAGIWTTLILFFMLSVIHQGVRLGRKTYVIDLASGNRRTDYIAVGNSVIGAMLLIVGIGGALLAQQSIAFALGFFALSSLLAWLLSRRLPEV